MGQLEALALTLAMELPVVLGIAWYTDLRDDPVRVAGAAVAASLITHPFAWWFSVSVLHELAFWPRAAIIEVAVVLAEMVVYVVALKAKWPLAYVMALAANFFSFFGGLAIIRLL